MQGNPRETALAYIAGIIDGEGTVRINRCQGEKTMRSTGRKNPVHSPHVSFGMVCKKVPQFIQSVTGLGSIRLERVHQKNRRDIWRFAITSRPQVFKFLQMVRPYLLTKAEQADLVMAFCMRPYSASWKNTGIPSDELQWREEMHDAVRKLNAVGVPATTKSQGIREDEAIV